jgi:gamma-glutamyltranspeptidase/glutathione hydrolase
MVASSQPLATQIGLDILKKGGTAVAIAVNAALGLMEPTGSGVGGDLFAIVWDAKTDVWIKRQWKIAKDINDVLF